MKIRALLLLALLGGLSGCATTTAVGRIKPGLWWVCDGSKHSSSCGANPEKGLKKTCFTEGRAIKAFYRVPGGALIVRCT